MKILSVHFPKAGGSSIKKSLKDAFDLNIYQFLEVYYDDPIDENSRFRTDFESSKRDASDLYRLGENLIIHGHFSPRKFEHLNFDCRFTIIRNPIDWLVSLFNYWNYLADFDYKAHQCFENFKKERPGIYEFSEKNEIRYCMSKLYFEGDSLEAFDFVGIQERYGETIKRISSLLGITLDEKEENITDELIEGDVPRFEYDRKKLESKLRRDLSMYDSLCSKFW